MEDLKQEAIVTTDVEQITDVQTGEDSDIESQTDKVNEPDTPEVAENIKNIINQFKSPEELAKAKLNTDSAYSKLQAKNRVLEQMLEDKTYKSEKKLATNNRDYLIEMVRDDNYELAEKLAQEIYSKSLDEIIEEIEDDMLVDQETEAMVADALGTKIKTYTKEDIDNLIDIKATKKLIEKESKLKETQESKKIETSYDDFIKEKGFDKGSKEEKAFAEIYNELIEGKKKSIELTTKVLKASFSMFTSENEEYNKTLLEKKNNLKNSVPLSVKGKSGETISYSADDKRMADLFKINILDYMETKKKYNK